MTEANTERDTRSIFYDRYVSSFNETNAAAHLDDSAQFSRWASARYLPHFRALNKDAAILELGCGHGRMLRYLAQQGYSNVVGVDISEEQIAIAKAGNFDARCEDVIEHLVSHIASYDLIIAIDVVEHFRRDELIELFQAIHSALRPGGIVLLQTANGEGLFPGHVIYGDLTHQTIFNPSSMEQLLKLTGFSAIAFSETAPLASGAIGMLRSILWSGVKLRMNFWRKIESGKTQKLWTENMIVSAVAGPV